MNGLSHSGQMRLVASRPDVNASINWNHMSVKGESQESIRLMVECCGVSNGKTYGARRTPSAKYGAALAARNCKALCVGSLPRIDVSRPRRLYQVTILEVSC